MARLYARKHGRSHSIRPITKSPPAWVKYGPEEVEALVIKLGREGNSPSKIGVILRDQYGIPLVKPIAGKKINQILKGAGLELKIPEDLNESLKKATALRLHLEKNRTDSTNVRSLELLESKIYRLSKYYRKKKILPPDWKYEPAVAALT
ncbi:MAG TPA: 30S ribosomal protein S15 [archaeon]|nr:30S ribosomal protein S15 [archaeon]